MYFLNIMCFKGSKRVNIYNFFCTFGAPNHIKQFFRMNKMDVISMLKRNWNVVGWTSSLLMIIWLLNAPAALAQSPDPIATLDSLLECYDSSKGTTRFQIGEQVLKLCGQQTVFFGEPPTHDGRQSAKQQDVSVWFAAGRYLTTNSYYKEALNYINKALEIITNEDNEVHETLLCDKAYCLFKTSDYMAAVEVGREAMRMCLHTGNTLQLSRAFLYLSLVNHSLRKYDEAKALVLKAIDTNELLGDSVQLHNTLGIACEIFCSALEVDKAIEYGRKAVEVARKINYQPGVANHLTQLSYAFDRKGDYEQGLQVADEAIAIVKSQNPLDRNQLALTLEYKSWNLIDIGRHEEAVEALREAIRLEEEVGNTHAAWNDLRTLAEAMGPIDPHGALDVLNRYIRMSDTIHAQQLKELMSQANAEFHNDELLEENTESRRLNRILISTTLVIVLLLAAVIASLWFAFRQKKRSADALRRLTEVRESFFTNVTHEFRTPLTVIMGLGKELQENADFREIGETIERQGTHLLALVNQLLDISKVKSAIGPQKQIQGDLAAYVGMILERQREVARQKDISIDYETDPEGIPAEFTEDYVEKVVGNLLSNAIKFSPQGGRIGITLHVVAKQVVLNVTDHGHGIADTDLPNIFEPFYQADETYGQGSGVGLALVKQIVDALHGKIEVKSQVEKGSTFTIQLPYAKPTSLPLPAVSENGSQQTNREPGNRVSLLIVEDNSDVARLISHQLGDGYDVHFASDGEEGIQKARELLPDLIITDLMMPHTDGLQLCRTMREDPVTNHIPLIVITAKATEEDRIRGLEAGADAYLTKPFNTEELNVRVKKLLELRRLFREKYEASPEALVATPVPEELPSSPMEDNKLPSFQSSSEDFLRRMHETVVRLIPQGSCDVESIAAALYITPSQLRRKMNAITGMPPKKYIMKVRMDLAHQQLHEHPEAKLADIAEQCGFYDLSHFIRLYKETYGTTPAANR